MCAQFSLEEIAYRTQQYRDFLSQENFTVIVKKPAPNISIRIETTPSNREYLNYDDPNECFFICPFCFNESSCLELCHTCIFDSSPVQSDVVRPSTPPDYYDENNCDICLSSLLYCVHSYDCLDQDFQDPDLTQEILYHHLELGYTSFDCEQARDFTPTYSNRFTRSQLEFGAHANFHRTLSVEGISASKLFTRPARIRNLAPLFMKEGSFEQRSWDRALPFIEQCILENASYVAIEPQSPNPITKHNSSCASRHPWKSCPYNPASDKKLWTFCSRCNKKTHFVNLFGVCRVCTKQIRSLPKSYEVQPQVLGSLFGVDVNGANRAIQDFAQVTEGIKSKLDCIDNLFEKSASPTFLLSVGGFLVTCFTDTSVPLRVAAFANCVIAFLGYKDTFNYLNDCRKDLLTWFTGLCNKQSQKVITYLDWLKNAETTSTTDPYPVMPQGPYDAGVTVVALVATLAALGFGKCSQSL